MPHTQFLLYLYMPYIMYHRQPRQYQRLWVQACQASETYSANEARVASFPVLKNVDMQFAASRFSKLAAMWPMLRSCHGFGALLIAARSCAVPKQHGDQAATLNKQLQVVA